MVHEIRDLKIEQVRGYWEVHINGEFFCTADTYPEAIDEIKAVYGK